MRSIYQSFAANHGDAALGAQQAQRALRKRYADPFYWAGFYVAGGRP
jgi:CHAT domain-containing protein